MRGCTAARFVWPGAPRDTIGTRGGGLNLAQKQTRADAEEPADKLPELFDLHVMMFADRSAATAAALQQTFSLDRSVAESLLAETPMVVKRCADPTVAAALLDALQKLGAQVVLLPSAASQPIPTAQTAAQGSSASLWGGLDLTPPTTSEATPEPDVAWRRVAATVEPEADLEEDLSGSDEPLPSELPDAFAGSNDADETAVETPFVEDDAEPLALQSVPALAPPEPSGIDLGLGTVPPLPPIASVQGVSAPPISLPPAIPAQLSRGPGLAPLPPAVSVPPPVPARVPPATRGASTPKPAAKPAAQPRRADPHAAVMPELRLPELMPAKTPQKRAAQLEPIESARSLESPADDTAARKPTATSAPSARSRFMALAELLFGVLVIYMGVHLENSVLYGNANYLSLALHGLAFYGIGAGIAGLWP